MGFLETCVHSYPKGERKDHMDYLDIFIQSSFPRNIVSVYELDSLKKSVEMMWFRKARLNWDNTID